MFILTCYEMVKGSELLFCADRRISAGLNRNNIYHLYVAVDAWSSVEDSLFIPIKINFNGPLKSLSLIFQVQIASPICGGPDYNYHQPIPATVALLCKRIVLLILYYAGTIY